MRQSIIVKYAVIDDFQGVESDVFSMEGWSRRIRTKQNLYREAGVREYWIVDPSMRRTMVTRFAEDPAPIMCPFEEPIPVGIYPGLAINLDEIVKGA